METFENKIKKLKKEMEIPEEIGKEIRIQVSKLEQQSVPCNNKSKEK